MRVLVVASLILCALAAVPASAQETAIVIDAPRLVEADCSGEARLSSLTTIVVLAEVRAVTPAGCPADPLAPKAAPGATLVLEAPVIEIRSGALLVAGDGRAGVPRTVANASGVHVGQDGGDGGWVRLLGDVRGEQGVVQTGAGGAGGAVEGWARNEATIQGGRGGDAGRIAVDGAGGLRAEVRPATGGAGGDATLRGLPGAAAGAGLAGMGGAGGASWGNPPPPGGPGGQASAFGAPGAAGTRPASADAAQGAAGARTGEGAEGGDATAVGGSAGAAIQAATSQGGTAGPGEAPKAGMAGAAMAVGGPGGRGADAGVMGQDPCSPAGNGGPGGRGGMGIARAGTGTANASDPRFVVAHGGRGGDGGAAHGAAGRGGDGGRGGFADAESAGPLVAAGGDGGKGGAAVWQPGNGGRGGDYNHAPTGALRPGAGGDPGARLAPCPSDPDGPATRPAAVPGQDGRAIHDAQESAPPAPAALLALLLLGLASLRSRVVGKP